MDSTHRKRSYAVHDALQRDFDIVISATLLVLLSPFLLIIGIIIQTNLGSPVLFTQPRPGKGGRTFALYKFRTMKGPVNPSEHHSGDEERLTTFGQKLRSTSLDELPELMNVFVGEMSIVGPRPLLPEYLPLYNDEQARRHEVRPGITGLAQVSGRNTLTWEEKFALDVEYVDNRSFLLDLTIMIKTVGAVFKRSGISQEGRATMEPFAGTPTDVVEGQEARIALENVVAEGAASVHEQSGEK